MSGVWDSRDLASDSLGSSTSPTLPFAAHTARLVGSGWVCLTFDTLLGGHPMALASAIRCLHCDCIYTLTNGLLASLRGPRPRYMVSGLSFSPFNPIAFMPPKQVLWIFLHIKFSFQIDVQPQALSEPQLLCAVPEEHFPEDFASKMLVSY